MIELTDDEQIQLFGRVRQAPTLVETVKVKREANPNHNVNIFGATIKHWIPGIDNDDLRWLANRSAKIHKKLDKAGGCVDNYRICLLVDNRVNEDYRNSQRNGCCGFYDAVWTNPKTQNRFSIGFNYGH